MKCPVCGRECRDEDNFCSNCGTRLKLPSKGRSSEALDRMIDDFRRRLEDNPKNPDVYYNLALAYSMKGEEEMAIIQLKNVIALDPSFSDAFLLLGKLCIKQRRFEEGKKYLEKFLELEPSRDDVKELLKKLGNR